MSSEDIANKIVVAEKELKEMIGSESIVTEQILKLRHKKTEITGQIQQLQIAETQSKNSVKQKRIEISLLTKEFWSEKNSGG